MSIVHECSAENCRTLTMGQLCVEHEKDEVFEDFFARELESRAVCRQIVRTTGRTRFSGFALFPAGQD